MDSFNKYKRFSEKLDVKAILCNKSWWVFNDSGEKEIYIFQEDGSLIVSLNGNVTVANWKYIPVNKSLIINSKEQSYMLHPAFSDNNILALQKDGTELYSFMILEEQLQLFKPKSLSELNSYFEQKRKAEIEEEQKRLQMQRESERQRYLEEAEAVRRKKRQEIEVAEIARRKKQQELREKNIQRAVKKETDKALKENLIYRIILCVAFILAFIVPVIIFIRGYKDGICKINDIKDGIAAAFAIIVCVLTIWLSVYIPLLCYVKKKIDVQIRIKYQNENFESIDEFEARIEKEKQDNLKKEQDRIREENKRKEWSEYLKQRDQRDFERIERYRIEREMREKNRKI